MCECATAAALHLAKAHLEKLGWQYTAEDIGNTARLILDGMAPPEIDT